MFLGVTCVVTDVSPSKDFAITSQKTGEKEHKGMESLKTGTDPSPLLFLVPSVAIGVIRLSSFIFSYF